MARLRDVVFDCRHPASLARFWAAVLDDYEVAPYDAAELARLRSAGIDDPEDDPTVLVESADPTAPRLCFQRVPEAKVVKNRVHLDVIGPATELDRLIALGAERSADGDEWTVMLDPEGNEFCLFEDAP